MSQGRKVRPLVHELSLVEALCKELLQQGQEQEWPRVTRIALRVGEMRQVVPDVLLFCFDVASKGTILEGAVLDIVPVPLLWMCLECGNVWPGDAANALCPNCGAMRTVLREGMELEIDFVEVEDFEENPEEATKESRSCQDW